MKVSEAVQSLGLNVVTLPSPDREISGGYVGDLLSWVMGRVEESNAWITIMTNINVVAVASLSDVSCVILCESVIPEKDVIDTATSKGINILSTESSAFDVSSKLSALLK